jgi:ppGpp synthetase/RelA/SpoT-type nucleotidyltranferase
MKNQDLNFEGYSSSVSDEQNYYMAWSELQYSGNQIRKAGKALINAKTTPEEYSQAMKVLSNWRSSHTYPLNKIQTWLRRQGKRVDSSGLVSQRLKRTPSIKNKLNRIESMGLERMQDIGGCRAILKDTRSVYKLKNNLINSRSDNILISQKDYIENPKNSGYRGIHLIYKYGGKWKEVYSKQRVEIQIRTITQHSWATSVEIVGAFTKKALKSGQGSEKWLYFFELVSKLFSYSEGYPCSSLEELENVKSQAIALTEELSVFQRLEGFSKGFELIDKFTEEKKKRASYFLIELNMETNKGNISIFEKDDLIIASDLYATLEERHKDNPGKDIVLVGLESIKNLAKAYPNYFANSDLFLEKLKEVL